MDSSRKARIKKMIVERLFLPVDPASIDDGACLTEQYGIDSVALFELVVGLEDEFGVSMEDADFSVEAFESVNSIEALLAAREA